MGCDIHISIERRDIGGQWECVNEAMPERIDNRCYSLFGILADVRNGTGFAGIVTGETWPSIAPDRGFPSDMVTKISGGYNWLGDHSYTYVGLDELKAFDWDGTVRRLRGVVTFKTWREWQKAQTTEPASYSGMVYGQGVEIISESDAHERTANLHDRLYVEASWSVTAREATDDWAGDILPVLERLADGGELRLILSFDS